MNSDWLEADKINTRLNWKSNYFPKSDTNDTNLFNQHYQLLSFTLKTTT